MRLALGEQRDENVGARHLLAAGGLDVNDGALDDALEARRRFRLFAVFKFQIGEFILDKFVKLPAQKIHVDIAGPHHRRRIAIVGEREQKMLERRQLVIAFRRQRDGVVQGFVQTPAK